MKAAKRFPLRAKTGVPAAAHAFRSKGSRLGRASSIRWARNAELPNTGAIRGARGSLTLRFAGRKRGLSRCIGLPLQDSHGGKARPANGANLAHGRQVLLGVVGRSTGPGRSGVCATRALAREEPTARLGTDAQIAADRPQIPTIPGPTTMPAADAAFRLGMGKTRPLKHLPNPSCHAGGRGFESRRSRSIVEFGSAVRNSPASLDRHGGTGRVKRPSSPARPCAASGDRARAPRTAAARCQAGTRARSGLPAPRAATGRTPGPP